jgi:hypothetical protein
MSDGTPPGPGGRLRRAARPSLGLALTGLGVVVAVIAVVAGSGHGGSPVGKPVTVCRTETVRSTVRRPCPAATAA